MAHLVRFAPSLGGACHHAALRGLPLPTDGYHNSPGRLSSKQRPLDGAFTVFPDRLKTLGLRDRDGSPMIMEDLKPFGHSSAGPGIVSHITSLPLLTVTPWACPELNQASAGDSKALANPTHAVACLPGIRPPQFSPQVTAAQHIILLQIRVGCKRRVRRLASLGMSQRSHRGDGDDKQNGASGTADTNGTPRPCLDSGKSAGAPIFP